MDIPLNQPKTTALNRGYLIGVSGVFLWSWTGIFISYLLKNYPLAPMTLAFWRDVIVTGSLFIGFALFRRSALRIAPHDRKFLLLYGLSLTFMNVTWTWSVALNGAAVSTVLVYASPGITALAARVFFKERLSPIRIAAFISSLIGCVFVARANDPAQWNLNAGGILIGVLSAFSFTGYSLMGKAVSHRQINSWTATLGAFAVAAVALLPIATLSLSGAEVGRTSLLSLGTHWGGWLILFVLAVIPTIGGFGLYTASLGYLAAGTANLIATLEPVLTTIWAYILLHESLDPAQLLGGAFIIASVISLRLEEKT
ncbi:MAG TPA: DMT family transporter [Anaerolineae bacterium]|nr:DMT family transporter [Anaerolineae bacterium]